MVDSIPTQQFFDMWKKGLEDSTQAWARLLSQSTAAPPDPTAFWRPAVEQWVQTRWRRRSVDDRKDDRGAQAGRLRGDRAARGDGRDRRVHRRRRRLQSDPQ